MLDILSAIIANKVSGGGSGGSGGGLPSGGEPHQMLVTDTEGKTVWEERTHYKGLGITLKIENASLYSLGSESSVYMYTAVNDDRTSPYLIESLPSVDTKCIVRFANETYETKAVSAPEMAEMIGGDKNTPFIGNLAIMAAMMGMPDDAYSDTGEPFVIAFQWPQNFDAGYQIMVVSTIESETLDVEAYGDVYKHLDARYLPTDGTEPYAMKDVPNSIVVVTITDKETGATDMDGFEIYEKYRKGYAIFLKIPSATSGHYILPLARPSQEPMFAGYTYDNAYCKLECWKVVNSTATIEKTNKVQSLAIGTVGGLRLTSKVSGSFKTYTIDIDADGKVIATEVTT